VPLHYYMTFYVCFRYVANKSMEGRAFCNADGDFLIVPQHGSKFFPTYNEYHKL
jgi:homogentisate 1,2-dioxygenase